MSDHKNPQSPVLTNKYLTALLKKCKRYVNNERYVYKICCDVSSKKDKDSVKWLVVMEKTKDTITNETRSNVADIDHAKFRANTLKVIKIFNRNSPNLTKRYVVNKYDKTTLRYTIGKIVEPDNYYENINKVCANGIHYFKTLEAAYYYGDVQKYYTGYWTSWHDNGQKSEEGNYVKGRQSGHWIDWHENGLTSDEGEYINGQRTGHWIHWHDNGQRSDEGNYVNGESSGHWINWHDNGQKSDDGNYVNGNKSGHWISWYNNGNKSDEGDYVNGTRSGQWTYWRENGHKMKECNYVDGMKSSQWTYWNESGLIDTYLITQN